jgi:hypothetical protein
MRSSALILPFGGMAEAAMGSQNRMGYDFRHYALIRLRNSPVCWPDWRCSALGDRMLGELAAIFSALGNKETLRVL